ncbi:MAG: DUF4159 domain-containing protein [Crocinitomicaceae bacterium]
MSYRKFTIIAFFIVSSIAVSFVNVAKNNTVQIGLLKYNGGGDWYANPTALKNLANFCNKNIQTNISTDVQTVEAGSSDIFNYPFVHMTGHGNVVFSNEEAKNLKNYLIGGGFLHIDDNYGMDKFIRIEIKKIFPNTELIELPSNHLIYNQKYKFPKGLPKIHEHDNKKAQGFGIVYEGRLVCYYTYETDLGDGWEDKEVHNDSEDKRQEALKMGANIISYVFSEFH